jgi:hypothetical protein
LRRAEIDPLGYRNEANRAACELAEATQRLRSITSKTIQTRHHDGIYVRLPGFQERQHPSTTRTVSERTSPGHAPVLDDRHKLSVGYLAPCFDATKLRGKAHTVERLLLGGAPGVADDSQASPQ